MFTLALGVKGLFSLGSFWLYELSVLGSGLPLMLFSHQVKSDSLRPRGLQHTKPPCPSPTPGVCPRSCPLHQCLKAQVHLRNLIAANTCILTYYVPGNPLETTCAQSCLTLCDPMDWSPLGSSVHRILQARILQWVAIPFLKVSSQPRD